MRQGVPASPHCLRVPRATGLARSYGPVRALQRLRAVLFDADKARLLGIEAGAPGLYIERRGFLADGRVIEATQSWYRGDAYDFVAELDTRG